MAWDKQIDYEGTTVAEALVKEIRELVLVLDEVKDELQRIRKGGEEA